LRALRGKAAFFESVEAKAVPKAQVQVVLERPVEIGLLVRLAAKCAAEGLMRGQIAGDFHRVCCLDLALPIRFLRHVDTGRVVEGWMGQGKDEGTPGLEQDPEGTEERTDVSHVEEGHVAKGGIKNTGSQLKERPLIRHVHDAIFNPVVRVGLLSGKPHKLLREVEREDLNAQGGQSAGG
jgi:hypothetical protein